LRYDADADTYSDPHTDSDSHSDAYAYAYANPDTHSDSYAYGGVLAICERAYLCHG
jgi:hypothetical protein